MFSTEDEPLEPNSEELASLKKYFTVAILFYWTFFYIYALSGNLPNS